MTLVDLVILIATASLCGWLVYKIWNYHDKKIAEADEIAKNIIDNAEKKAKTIIEDAQYTKYQELEKIENEKDKIERIKKILDDREKQIEIKKQNLAKEHEFIEAKNRRQNELLSTIKHIVMSDKKFKYDLKQRIRKILMENNI
jgi:ribonuclease Y